MLTDANGQVLWQNVADAGVQRTVRVQVPAGYQAVSPQTVTGAAGETVNVTFNIVKTSPTPPGKYSIRVTVLENGVPVKDVEIPLPT